MMQRIYAKLKSNSGASIILVLVLFLICIMISSVIVVAASSGASRNANRNRQQQGYLSISSAAAMITDEMESGGKFVGKAELLDYGCNETGVKQYEPGRLDEVMLEEVIPMHEDITEADGVGIWNADMENTALGGVFKDVLFESCKAIYSDGETGYTTMFTIESEDTHILDVECEFSMNASYGITIILTTVGSDYSLTLSFAGSKIVEKETIEEGHESALVCAHDIKYSKVEAGAITGEVTETIDINGIKTISRTVVTWAAPMVTKGG